MDKARKERSGQTMTLSVDAILNNYGPAGKQIFAHPPPQCLSLTVEGSCNYKQSCSCKLVLFIYSRVKKGE